MERKKRHRIIHESCQGTSWPDEDDEPVKDESSRLLEDCTTVGLLILATLNYITLLGFELVKSKFWLTTLLLGDNKACGTLAKKSLKSPSAIGKVASETWNLQTDKLHRCEEKNVILDITRPSISDLQYKTRLESENHGLKRNVERLNRRLETTTRRCQSLTVQMNELTGYSTSCFFVGKLLI